MVTPTNHVIARDLWWHFGDFRNIFLPNIMKTKKKVLLSERGIPGSVPYGKSGPGYCITLIERLDEAWGSNF